MTIEYTFNDNQTAPFTSVERRAYEHVIRQLLLMQPAVVLLHHYSWWAQGQPPGQFYMGAEAQLTMFSHVSVAVLPCRPRACCHGACLARLGRGHQGASAATHAQDKLLTTHPSLPWHLPT